MPPPIIRVDNVFSPPFFRRAGSSLHGGTVDESMPVLRKKTGIQSFANFLSLHQILQPPPLGFSPFFPASAQRSKDILSQFFPLYQKWTTLAIGFHFFPTGWCLFQNKAPSSPNLSKLSRDVPAPTRIPNFFPFSVCPFVAATYRLLFLLDVLPPNPFLSGLARCERTFCASLVSDFY